MGKLAIDKIKKSPLNPRDKLGDISDLTASIKAIGVVEPLVITTADEEDGKHQLVAGYRRLAAAKRAGLEEVPVDIRTEYQEERSRIAAMLAENMQREDLSPLQEAQGMFALSELGMTYEEIGNVAGVSKSKVAERIQLNNLPAKVKKLVKSDQLSIEEAEDLLPYVDTPKVIHEVIRQAEEQAKEWGRDGIYIGSLVTNMDREREWTEELEKVKPEVDALVELGVTILNDGEPYSYTDVKRQWKQIGDSIDVPIEEHIKTDCHMAGVRNLKSYGRPKFTINHWCIRPANHRATGSSELKVPDLDAEHELKQEEREARRIERAAKQERYDQYDGLCRRRFKATALSDLFARAFLYSVHHETKVKAMKMLGISPIVNEASYGPNKDWRATEELTIEEMGAEKFALAVLLTDADPLENVEPAGYGLGSLDLHGWLTEQGAL